MTYNMYNTQLAMSWVQRVNKEEKVAQQQMEKQLMRDMQEQQALGAAGALPLRGGSMASYAASSKAPTGYTSKTSFLRSRLENLESQLQEERESRRRVEDDLHQLRAQVQPTPPRTPATPKTPQQ